MLKIRKNTQKLMDNVLQYQAILSDKESLPAETMRYSSPQSFLDELDLWNHSLKLQKVKLCEIYERGRDSAENHASDKDENFIQKVRRIIETHLSNATFDVDSLSKEMGLSHAQFCCMLQTYTDESPAELLRNCRLQRAAAMLNYSTYSISEIAYSAGFHDPEDFNRSFKDVFGIYPSQYQAYEIIRFG